MYDESARQFQRHVATVKNLRELLVKTNCGASRLNFEKDFERNVDAKLKETKNNEKIKNLKEKFDRC